MRLAIPAAVAILCVSSLAAHADTYDYNFSAIDGVACELQGQCSPVTLNFQTNVFGEKGNFPVTVVQNTVYSTILPSIPSLTSPSGTVYFTPTYFVLLGAGTTYDPSFDMFDIYVSNPNGSALALGTSTVQGEIGGTSVELDTDGCLTITDVSQTPEPSSVALLGTGLLGIAGVVRKRFS